MSERPNVLILMTDQQRYDTLHCAGYEHMVTPNLDRLAAGWCLYTHAHTTNPVCLPARYALLTGMPGRAHGLFRNSHEPIRDPSLPTLPGLLSTVGYRTAAIGKCHHRPVCEHHGFDELQLMEEVPTCREYDEYAQYLADHGLGDIQNLHGVRALLYHHAQNAQMPAEHHPNAWVADRSIEWLHAHRNEPFYLFCSWIHPHPPRALPLEDQHHYDGTDLPEPIPAEGRPALYGDDADAWCGLADPESERRRIRAFYFSSITMVDHHIGRVLDTLEAIGQLENTLIVFLSDHGEMLQDHGMCGKQTRYDSSVRIPLIVRYPERFRPGAKCDDLVDLLDVLPTCLDVCGVTYPEDREALVGESLYATDPVLDRRIIFSANGCGPMRWVMARDQRFKYVYWYWNGLEQIYDLEADPDETSDLVAAGRVNPDVLDRLRERALRYEQRWGPDNVINVKDGLKSFGRHDRTLSKLRNSKYPHGASTEFQTFGDGRPDEAGPRFGQEFARAVAGLDTRSSPFETMLNDPAWSADIQVVWQALDSDSDLRACLGLTPKQDGGDV